MTFLKIFLQSIVFYKNLFLLLSYVITNYPSCSNPVLVVDSRDESLDLLLKPHATRETYLTD